MVKEQDDTTFWHWTGLFGNGHVTYAPGQLTKEGPFHNPARLVEEQNSDPWPSVWAHAGWWDKEYAR